MYKLYLKTIKKECIYDDELLSLVDFIKESRNNSNEVKDIKNMIEIEYSFWNEKLNSFY